MDKTAQISLFGNQAGIQPPFISMTVTRVLPLPISTTKAIPKQIALPIVPFIILSTQ